MTTPSELDRLAERVEAATGPDRKIDGEIDRLIHDRPKDGDYCPKEKAIWRVKDGWSGLLVRGDGFARDSFWAASYTSSLDAAMTLGLGRGDVFERIHEALIRCPLDSLPDALPRYLSAAFLRAFSVEAASKARADGGENE